MKYTVSAPIKGTDLIKNHVCYSLEEAEEIMKEIKGATVSSSLTDDQQVVLEWLKYDFKESGNPIDSLESLAGEVLHVETFQTCISSAFDGLGVSEQLQVLAAFAEWGSKEEQS